MRGGPILPSLLFQSDLLQEGSPGPVPERSRAGSWSTSHPAWVGQRECSLGWSRSGSTPAVECMPLDPVVDQCKGDTCMKDINICRRMYMYSICTYCTHAYKQMGKYMHMYMYMYVHVYTCWGTILNFMNQSTSYIHVLYTHTCTCTYMYIHVYWVYMYGLTFSDTSPLSLSISPRRAERREDFPAPT